MKDFNRDKKIRKEKEQLLIKLQDLRDRIIKAGFASNAMKGLIEEYNELLENYLKKC